jgi:tRNA(Ile)-lysidine synthase
VESTKLQPLEFRIFKKWRDKDLKKKLLVACSGGADSVALLHIMARVAPRLGINLSVAHVHHGPAAVIETQIARAKAQTFVAELAKKLGLKFYTVTRSSDLGELSSEQDLRNFRHQSLQELRVAIGFDLVAFAHHSDDLFETRLIRLIRGTGPQGLRAMQELEIDRGIFRPLLDESRQDLLAYLTSQNLSWLEDPTNVDREPLRNWVRHSWLPDLEKKRPGAIRAFSRSLGLMAMAAADLSEQTESIADDVGRCDVAAFGLDASASIDRQVYEGLNEKAKRQLIASYLRQLELRDFATTHVEEIVKRLDSYQKVFTFELLQCRWEINAQQLRARRF